MLANCCFWVWITRLHQIWDNPKLYPFFKDCHWAIDGTHIDAFVPDDAVAHYRNHKGSLSQNDLAACTFDMQFCSILPSWWGSAANGCVFDNAWWESLAILPGTYFLADAGFPTCDVLIIPYKGERYHLKEWGNVLQKYLFIYNFEITTDFVIRPRNYKELYNLRHPQAQNVVEHIFGVVKQQFHLMVAALEYSLETRSKIIPALCTLHSFIWVYNQDEDMGVEGLLAQAPRCSQEDFNHPSVFAQEKARANTKGDVHCKGEVGTVSRTS